MGRLPLANLTVDKNLRAVSASDTNSVWRALMEALAGGDALCVTDAPLASAVVSEECAVVVLTSGSTAKPKRVALSAEALLQSARATAEAIGTGGWMLALPLDYIAGLMVLVRTAEAGRMPVEFTAARFDAAEFCRAVRELHDDTWFTALVPAQLVRLIDFAEVDTDARDALRRFERILVGGQAIPVGLIDRATALGVRVTTTYGSAETAGGVVYDGTPIGDTEVRISSDGQIDLSTSSLALGYLDNTGNVTPWSFSTEGDHRWWHTTDIGAVNDGVLTVLGRTDDVIVTGGIKVSLGDVDRVLEAAGVNAVASWFADDTWGQVPALVSETELDRDAVRDLIEREVSTEARPYRFVTVPELPRLSSGKIDRRAVHGLVANVES